LSPKDQKNDPANGGIEMKTVAGDVIICRKPNVSIRLVAVVMNDGQDPFDITDWRAEGRLKAEAMARATISNTGGRVLFWDGVGELERLDND
jgi:hypothetical protein